MEPYNCSLFCDILEPAENAGKYRVTAKHVKKTDIGYIGDIAIHRMLMIDPSYPEHLYSSPIFLGLYLPIFFQNREQKLVALAQQIDLSHSPLEMAAEIKDRVNDRKGMLHISNDTLADILELVHAHYSAIDLVNP